ncbi:MAG: CaiB/BaiF CoA transferase family protein [Hyphomicrobiaceae bacterium]
MTATAKPLPGLRVLELSHTVMGPTAGLIMADLGADVIKVEPAPKGDHTRGLAGFASGFFAGLNRNKRGIALNLKMKEGQEALHRLAATADVMLENYGPGTIERLGCGWDVLEKVNPRLIYLALKGYLAGPYEKRPALDEVVQFQSGLAYMTGPPGRPLRAGASIIDITGAMFGVIAVQAALRERDVTGKGQRVSSSLFESAVFLMSTHMAGSAATGEPMPPMPARRGAWAIYEVFPCSDGELFIGVTSDQQWARFVEEFGLETLSADPRLQTNVMRVKERDWLIPELKAVIAPLSKAEVQERLERAACSWAPVGRPDDLFDDPHLLATGGLLETLIPRLGGGGMLPTKLPALPMEFGADRARGTLRCHAPTLGQHNTEVLSEAGYAPAEIASLAEKGAIVGG